MLQVARLAPNLLHEAGDRVEQFFRDQINEDGGGKDRSGDSDLYYTVFALEGLIALQVDPPYDLIRVHLLSFGGGDDLDFVHLCCLARCWAAIPDGRLDPSITKTIQQHIESFRSADGGYNATLSAESGTIYHSFLACGAYQDMGEALQNTDQLIDSIMTLNTSDGAFANDRRVNLGTTTTTAAAVTLLRQLDVEVDSSVGDWLLAQCHGEGGFLAMPQAPMPDLLSTATALHALAGMQVSFESVKERCLDFVDSLWTGQAFCGHWADDAQDSEYTYYALLALGHLSL